MKVSELKKRKFSKNFSKNPMAEINVTPFVDVMLVLLIVFMITAPLLTTGIKIDLPDASNPVLTGNDEPLIITITSKEEVFLSERKIKINELNNKLESIKIANPQMRIFIRADKNINYSILIQVISKITKAGLSKISLVTLPEK